MTFILLLLLLDDVHVPRWVTVGIGRCDDVNNLIDAVAGVVVQHEFKPMDFRQRAGAIKCVDVGFDDRDDDVAVVAVHRSHRVNGVMDDVAQHTAQRVAPVRRARLTRRHRLFHITIASPYSQALLKFRT